MELTIVELLQGLFSLIYVIITLIIGLIFLSKFLKYKSRDLLLVGITWIGIATPWMGDATNFILAIFYNTILSETNYLIITIAFIPLGILCWLIAITNLMFKNMQKIILLVITILSIIFEIIFFTLLFMDTSLVGTFLGPFQVEYSFIFQVYFMIYLALFVLPGILLARESLRSEKQETKLKGKLLLIAFILAIIGATLDSVIPLTAITVVITRIILSFGAIVFYMGWTLPEWAKNLFIKEN